MFGFSVGVLAWYLIIPYLGPVITLYRNDIEFNKGRSRSNLDYRDIETCSLHRETYGAVSFVVMKMTPKQGAKVRSWFNKPLLEIGIPNSIDHRKIVQTLEAKGIKMDIDMVERF